MIWLRRVLTIPLIVLFVATFVTLLIATSFSVSATDPDFYNDQLEKADAYNWVYDQFLPVALEEIEEDNPDLPIGAYARNDIVSAVRKTLPPEWLQERTESINNAVIPYIVGDTDEFAFDIPLKARVELGSQVIREDLLRGESATALYNDIMENMAEQVMNNACSLPYDFDLTQETVENALRMVFTEDWVIAQVDGMVQALTPYFVRDTDDFTIIIDVKDLIDPAAEATLQVLQTNYQQAYDYLIDEVISPMVEENLGSSVELVVEVVFSQEEIISAFRQVLPETWIYPRAEEIVHAMAAYLKGETDRIDVEIYLADRNAAAMEILESQADEALRAIYETLPVCSLAEYGSIISTLPPGTLPGCRPEGYPYDDFKDDLGIDVAAAVDANIGAYLPDSWLLTDEQFRESIGPDNAEFLDQARGWVASGWTFSDADLRARLDEDDEETLDDVRNTIADGYSVTEGDLREWMANEADMEMETFDRARQLSHDIRGWLWAFWLIPVLLLVAIGFLGGRNWRSRLAGPLVILLVTCLGVYIALTVIQARVIDPRANDFVGDPIQVEGMERAVQELGNDLAYNSVSSFIAGIEHIALYLMIASAILILALIVSAFLGPKQRETPQTPPEEPQDLRPGTPSQS